MSASSITTRTTNPGGARMAQSHSRKYSTSESVKSVAFATSADSFRVMIPPQPKMVSLLPCSALTSMHQWWTK